MYNTIEVIQELLAFNVFSFLYYSKFHNSRNFSHTFGTWIVLIRVTDAFSDLAPFTSALNKQFFSDFDNRNTTDWQTRCSKHCSVHNPKLGDVNTLMVFISGNPSTERKKKKVTYVWGTDFTTQIVRTVWIQGWLVSRIIGPNTITRIQFPLS